MCHLYPYNNVKLLRKFFYINYNSTQYCKTETVFSIFPFLQTNITSQMWPCGGKGAMRREMEGGKTRGSIGKGSAITGTNPYC